MLVAIVASTTAVGFGFGVAAMALSPHAPAVVTRTIGVPYPIMPPPADPPAAAEPEPAETTADVAVETRANEPMLDPACVLPVPQNATPPASCSWDHGFPAISSDGALIVVEGHPDDGGRGYPNLYIDFLDAHTGKPVRSITVLDSNEYDDTPEALDRLGAKIVERTAVAQKLLDAGHYRPLTLVDESSAGVRLESSDDAIRMFDTTVTPERVIFQHRFVPPHEPANPEHECSGFSLYRQSIYWDATQKVVLAEQTRRTGGCMCPDLDYDLVARY